VAVRVPQTFDAAVKHLFRYLDNVAQLQRNPIAKPFFAAANGSESPVRARQALATLRTRVMELAERFRDEDIAAGNDPRADRQFAIVKLHYFDGITLDDVAESLHVSAKHCYRERASICHRIASALSQQDKGAAVVTATEDGFYLLLDRLLEREADASPTELAACEHLQNLAKTTQQKIAASHAFTVLSIRLSDDPSAEAGYVRAARVYDEQHLALSPDLRRTAEASMSVLESILANHRGQIDRARAAAERAVQCLEQGPIERTMYADRLQVEARFNLSTTLWASGNLADAYDLVRETALRSDRLAPTSSIRIRAEGSLWKLRTHLLLNNFCTSEARIDGLIGAKERALRAGALSEAIDAMVSITECHVFAKHDAEALQSARDALALARTAQNPVEYMQVAIELGVRLLSTKYWRQALQLLPRESALGSLDDYRKRLHSYAIALGALKAGHVEKAWAFSTAPGPSDQWANLEARRGLLAAESANLLGRKTQARHAAEVAVATAERLGAAPLLRDAYAVSGLVLARPRVDAQAQEIARILAA
jgi:hypothetical protein